MKTRRSINILLLLSLLYTVSTSVQAENKLAIDEQNNGCTDFGKNNHDHIGCQDQGDLVSFKDIRIKSL